MVLMRFFVVFLFSFSSIYLNGQVSLLDDTIKIHEVIVRSSLLNSSTGGYKHNIIDTSLLKQFGGENLSQIISQSFPMFIKSYGPGGIATTSFRGAGAGHTQLTWNEINISSPMLGQADLSLIPAGFIDEIRIYSGGASMFASAGGLGGCINFDTSPEWKKEKRLSFDIGGGSFDNYSGFVKFKAGGENFQTVTRGLFNSAQNNFRFLNTFSGQEPFIERRKNSEAGRFSILQELYFRRPNTITSARVWFQSSDRNLPSMILMPQDGNKESQRDEFLRVLVNHNFYSKKSNLDFSVAWLRERLDYRNSLASINSRNLSNTLLLKGGLEALISEKTRLKIQINNELNSVSSVNYSELKTRNVSTFTGSIRKVFGSDFGSVILVRDLVENGRFLAPDFSAGIDFHILNENQSYLRMNFSRNSKLPSMNDLYWNPGGNPDLKNEYSYSAEMSWELKGKILKKLEYSTDLSLFSNKIRDMIQWRPGQSGLWSPVNLNSINSSGIESSLDLTTKLGGFVLKYNFQYSYTSSKSAGSSAGENLNGKQLIYVPENQINSVIRLNYKLYYFSWITSFTGRRYTTSDNSEYLPDYALNNLIAGTTFKTGKNSFDISIRIDNILNVNYQAIAYYPMPGRTLYLSIKYNIFK